MAPSELKKKEESDRIHVSPRPLRGAYKVADFVEKSLKNPWRYTVERSFREYFFRKLFILFFRLSEKIFGYSFYIKNTDRTLSPSWNTLIGYLKKNNFIKNYHILDNHNDLPKLFRVSIEYVAGGVRDTTNSTQHMPSTYTIGASQDFETALSKAVGEFFERYPLSVYKENDLIRASQKELRNKGTRIIDLKYLAGFSEEQIENEVQLKVFPHDEFLWVETFDILNQKKALIPAQLVFWTYSTTHKNWQEKTLRESNTHGGASSFSYETATLRGMYELIERDGFLIYWINTLSPEIIDVTEVAHEPLQNLLRLCKQYNLEVHFLKTATDLGVPSCGCVIVDDSGVGPKVSIGGGSDGMWKNALFSALSEALVIHIWSRESKDRKQGYIYLRSPDDPTIMSGGSKERIRAWGHPKMFSHFQFFLEGKKIYAKDLEDLVDEKARPKDELRLLLSKFKDMGKGYEVYVYEAKHAMLEKFNAHAVKVVIPQLVHLYYREKWAMFGAPRLFSVPKKLGFTRSVELNKWPHPFP